MFVALFTDIVINAPRDKEIHVIADNLSAHKSAPVKELTKSGMTCVNCHTGVAHTRPAVS